MKSTLATGVVFLGVCSWSILDVVPPAQAQIIPDTTLGAESSVLTPNIPIRGALGDRIEGGAARGSALFHSFDQFNVNEFQRVYFSNPAGIESILSRVTGNDVSDIMGTLGVDGAASLFLLNPNGVIFGENARLDISGSLVVSTGDRFTFPNGSSFSATHPQAPPLLTVTAPIGLQLGTGTITNDAILYAGNDLTLDGSNLDLEGQLWAGGDLTLRAADTLRVRDRVDAPFIAATQGEMVVQGDRTVDIFALSHPDSGFWSGGNMTLRSASAVGGDAHYSSGGDFRIEQLDTTLGGLESPNDPVIRATGDVAFETYSGASLHIFAGGSVSIPGFVWLQGADPVEGIVENTTLANGSVIPINGRTEPTLDIRAGTTAIGVPNLTPPTGLFTPAAPFPLNAPSTSGTANIDIGAIIFSTPDTNPLTGGSNITPQAGRILLTNLYEPNDAGNRIPGDITVTASLQDDFYQGRAILNGDFLGGGDVDIHARGDIVVDGIINVDPVPLTDFQDFSSVTLGNGGNVTLRSGQNITLTPNSLINSTGVLGGDIFLESGGDTILAGTSFLGNLAGIVSFSLGPDSANQGGDITIIARNLTLANNANVKTDTFPVLTPGFSAQANPGNINIQVAEALTLTDSSLISANIGPGGIGQPGDVTIQTGTLTLDGGSQIGSALFRTFNQVPGAQGGNERNTITITASDSIQLSGVAAATSGSFSSGILTLTERGASGVAGDIEISTGDLTITDSAVIAASTFNDSDGGSVTIDANNVTLLRGGQIIANSRADGNAGNINLTVADTLTITGIDPNFNNRLGDVFTFVQDPTNQTSDRIDDIIGNEGPNSGLFANTGDSFLTSFSLNSGGAGSVTVEANSIEMANAGLIQASTFGNGSGGDILLRTQSLNMESGAEILALTVAGAGNTGSITIEPLDLNIPSSVTISGFAPTRFADGTIGGFSSGLFASTERTTVFEVDDNGFSLLDASGAPIRTEYVSSGSSLGADGISIQVTTDNLTISNGGVIGTRSRSTGNAGSITINVNNLTLQDGGQILSAAFNSGNAGDITVNVSNALTIDGSDPDFGARVFELVAELQVDDPSLNFDDALDQALGIIDPVLASTSAVDIVETDDVVAPSGLQARSELSELPETPLSGNISVRAGSIRITNEAEVNSEQRNSNNVTDDQSFVSLLSSGSFTLDHSRVIATNSGSGLAGLVIAGAAEEMAIANQSQILSQGNLGIILIGETFLDELVDFVPETIEISGGSKVSTDNANVGFDVNNFTEDQQGAGTIFIRANGVITVTGTNPLTGDSTLVSSNTFNDADAGLLSLEAGSLVVEDSAQLSTSTIGTGDAGLILLEAGSMTIRNGAQVSSSTFGDGVVGVDGNAGFVFLNATGDILIDNSAIFTIAEAGAEGNAGDIFVEAQNLQMFNNAELQTQVNGANRSLTLPGAIGDAGSVLIEVDNLIVLDNSSIFSNIGRESVGNSGTVSVTSAALRLRNGAQIQTQIDGTNLADPEDDRGAGRGDAGFVQIGSDRIRMRGSNTSIFSSIGPGAIGQGGNVLIGRIVRDDNGQLIAIDPIERLRVINGAQIQAQTSGISGELVTSSDAGDIFIAAETIKFDGVGAFPSAAFTSVNRDSEGEGGVVFLTGGFRFDDQGSFERLLSANLVALTDGALVSAETFGTGSAGDIFLVTDRLEVGEEDSENLSSIRTSAGAAAQGAGGQIIIGSRVRINEEGNISRIQPANSVMIRQQGQLRAQTASRQAGSDAGDIFVAARNIRLGEEGGTSNMRTLVREGAAGAGGRIVLGDRIRFDSNNELLTIQPAANIVIANGAQLEAQTSGTSTNNDSDAGDVFVIANQIELDGAQGNRSSGIRTSVEENARGAGGAITLGGAFRVNRRANRTLVSPAQTITITNGAQLQAQTDGASQTADAGEVFVIGDRVTLDGVGGNSRTSGIITSSLENAQGAGGRIMVAGGLDVPGNGITLENNLSRNTSNSASQLSPSQNITTSNQDEAPAIALAAEEIVIANGAQLITETRSQAANADAGDVFLVGDRIILAGVEAGFPSAVFSSVNLPELDANSRNFGIGGSIFVSGDITLDETVINDDNSPDLIGVEEPFATPASRLEINDGAILSVSSFGRGVIGGQDTDEANQIAGNIFIAANTIDMDNDLVNATPERERGIFAETGEGNSGNITITADSILLLRGSTRISTSAGIALRRGEGGNITISTADDGFIIAEPFGNDDITSNAFNSFAGRTELNAEQVFGLTVRTGDDLRELLGTDDPAKLDTEFLPTSDVTAISQVDTNLDGEVFINVAGVDPSRGLAELPSGLVDGSDLIAEVCPTGPGASDRLGNFTVTGRGGLPPTPANTPGTDDLFTDWVEYPTGAEPDPGDDSSLEAVPDAIVEAQHWHVDDNNNIVLVASPNAHAHGRLGQPYRTCP
ncbi:MAG: filamentous hemagglutinin N-terminal domain-containing protein [Leptolyngbyaceae cyanobacterium]